MNLIGSAALSPRHRDRRPLLQFGPFDPEEQPRPKTARHARGRAIDRLRELDYSCLANRKTREGTQHPDRNAQLVDDPTQAIAVMKAMARREAGRESPLTDEQWRQAHAMFKAGSANAYLDSLAGPSPSPPTERPLDLAAAIVAAMRRKGYVIDMQPGEINIVYVEGLNEDGTPAPPLFPTRARRAQLHFCPSVFPRSLLLPRNDMDRSKRPRRGAMAQRPIGRLAIGREGGP